jgi:leader peptidase (prepilin peptidase)/N-methyltransferase
VVGYLSLWSIYWAFKLLTGKEGMGYGDFKLLAAIGAWLGWSALLPVILVASLCGTAVGLLLKWRSELREGGYVPFGPFLALGALAVPMYPPLGLWLLP